MRALQRSALLKVESLQALPLRFSFDYAMIKGRRDYGSMIAEADGAMYTAKRQRKVEQGSAHPVFLRCENKP